MKIICVSVSHINDISHLMKIIVLMCMMCCCLCGHFPVLSINSSRLSSLAEPGLGAHLSSYLEGVLYKLIYR